MTKEKIEHRKPDTFGVNFKGEIPPEVYDTYYDLRFNRDYVARDESGEVIAVCSDKSRLIRFLQEKTP